MELFGELFSNEALASISAELQDVADVDGELGDEEAAFLNGLIEAWQIV